MDYNTNFSVNIQVIPHEQQRYPTLGDFWWDEYGNLQIRISDLGDWRMNMGVAYHEFMESMFMKYNNISEPEQFTFDNWWEDQYNKGLVTDGSDEPGFSKDPKNCYRDEHNIADYLEHAFITRLGVDINKYRKKQESLYHQNDGGGC